MKEKLPNSTLYLMSASAGLIVANLYYNQPLLAQIADTFGVTESAVSNVALSTQLGYAFALFFIIPLGDKISTNKILRLDFLVMVISLLAAAMSTSLSLLIISSFFIGFTSALPQMFVPMAAQLSDDKGRGRAIGIVMSGLLIGILGSRVLSGLAGAQFGWRSVYYGGAVIMFALFILLKLKLPNMRPTYKGSYGSLMKSLIHYFKSEPLLRLAALRGALSFAGLSAFWTTLVFLLEDSFGYAGIAHHQSKYHLFKKPGCPKQSQYDLYGWLFYRWCNRHYFRSNCLATLWLDGCFCIGTFFISRYIDRASNGKKQTGINQA